MGLAPSGPSLSGGGETCSFSEADADGSCGCHAPAVAVTAWWMQRGREAIGEEFVCETHAIRAHHDGCDVEDYVTGRPLHFCKDCGDPVFGRAWGRCEVCYVHEAVAA